MQPNAPRLTPRGADVVTLWADACAAMIDAIGRPHLGQARAASETMLPQSAQVTSPTVTPGQAHC
jgi:hypothetical protein